MLMHVTDVVKKPYPLCECSTFYYGLEVYNVGNCFTSLYRLRIVNVFYHLVVCLALYKKQDWFRFIGLHS